MEEAENEPDEPESGLEVPFPRKEEIVLSILCTNGSERIAVIELPFGIGGRPELVTPLTEVELDNFNNELIALVSLNSMKYSEIPITVSIDAYIEMVDTKAFLPFLAPIPIAMPVSINMGIKIVSFNGFPRRNNKSPEIITKGVPRDGPIH
jgi:hypothetical protein